MRDTAGYIYKYEMHCHTAWCSACANNTPQEMAEAYFNKGYAGMVITDHFLRGNSAVDRTLPWAEKMQCYYNAYLAAKDWAEGKDFNVLFGLEHHYGDGKEVLTYGVDLDFLLAHENLHELPLCEYSRLVHEAGGFISMAHPFRQAPYINPDVLPQPQYLDAAEVFNFHNSDEDNERAVKFAEENGLLTTSGGDEHNNDGEGVGMAGIALKAPVKTGEELVAVLKSGDYRLVVNGKVV